MKFLYTYLLLMNAVGLLIMRADKEKAKKGAWRVPEATLIAVAALGGSLGCLIGMRLYRHKTKHPRFTVGIPALLVIQAAILAALVYRSSAS